MDEQTLRIYCKVDSGKTIYIGVDSVVEAANILTSLDKFAQYYKLYPEMGLQEKSEHGWHEWKDLSEFPWYDIWCYIEDGNSKVTVDIHTETKP